MLAVVDNYGHLAALRIEGLKWILNDDTTDRWFDYILDHNGEVYAVDDRGACVMLDVMLDSLLNLMEVASPLNLRYRPSFRKKYLVESSGDLLLVDEYTNANSYIIDHDILTGEVYSREQNAIFQAPIFFKVYKLDKRERKWVGVRDLGDRVPLVAPDYSYSISAHDFNGWSCMGNKIIFLDKFSEPNAPNEENTYAPLRAYNSFGLPHYGCEKDNDVIPTLKIVQCGQTWTTGDLEEIGNWQPRLGGH
ncbi:hypothetical protein Vadar_001716 [Vaccinium darrowii]|uniref:Uncharacterized protein n=1 Tax=Vaccinium darrowii TaxID=229202 RepID=A0ACB7ZHV5_9ERIC|nr:hypothetical protein Vadar_001716 [Vaccinium darrowii]